MVIPAWCWDEATLELLRGCVANVRATAPDAELVVVYAGVPTPWSLEEEVDQWVRIDPPQGWAAAANIGLLHSSGDYLVVGSVDIRLPEGWLEALRDAAGESAVASPIDVKRGVRRVWDATMRGSFWGGWFLFHRSILHEVGYFDGYAMRRLADMDWAIRARELGYATVRVESVGAEHVAPHHTLQAHPDPHDDIVRRAFLERHGHDRFGSYEGLPTVRMEDS